ncbi:hypothetical protein IF1G_03786 [Cordyceps javanica]|uniref:Uncharacterized protein n=1 Tax=Cordyceps javanica TaxID=43265 RepID=A0A545V8J5_9HYPO|nr:hypothetical protein IF1G_03786 [Cordyceps javanica]
MHRTQSTFTLVPNLEPTKPTNQPTCSSITCFRAFSLSLSLSLSLPLALSITHPILPRPRQRSALAFPITWNQPQLAKSNLSCRISPLPPQTPCLNLATAAYPAGR